MVHLGRSRVGLVVNIKEKIIANGPSPIDIMRTRCIRPEFRVFYRRYRDISGEGHLGKSGRNQFSQPNIAFPFLVKRLKSHFFPFLTNFLTKSIKFVN